MTTVSPSTPGTTRARRAALAAALGVLLFLVYLLTFSGLPISDDERFILDTVESFAVRDSTLLTQTSYLRPLQETDVEPAQPLLSVPLYWLAYRTPWVGNVHALYLFAPVVTALTGLLLFLTALDLGYRERTAIVATLLFGLTTIVWPYTKTYFREPLTMLNLFAAAFLLMRWRRAFRAGVRSHWVTLGAAVLVTLLALLSKEAMFMALPALLLLAYPGGELDRRRRRQILGILIGLSVLVVLIAAVIALFGSEILVWLSSYALLHRVAQLLSGLPDAGAGIAGYLVSPGKALWWYSPVLLLALGAPFVLPRQRWRESWLPLGLTLLFVLIYAAVRQEQWSGGTGWGARYLVPLVPFLMIAALPLIDRMLNSRRLWLKVVLALIALWGFTVQIGGTVVELSAYYDYLIANVTPTPWTGPPIWTFRWSQAVGSLIYLPQAPTDIRWLVPSPDWLMLAVLGAGGLAAAGMVVWLHRQRAVRGRLAVAAAAGLPLAAAVIAVLALWRAYADPRYMGTDPAVREMRTFLAEQAGRDDTIILASPTYVPHFMNYYKGRATWISLPWSPGERYSPEQTPELGEGDVGTLAGEQAVDTHNTFSRGGVYYNHQPLWLVMDLGPALAWAPRPVERYFSQAGYPVMAVDFNQYARVVQYLPLHAPTVDDSPAHSVDARFGEAMRLVGYDLVVNDDVDTFGTVSAGDALGLSLLWEAEATPGADYTVAVHLIGPDGQLVAQQDRAPVGGFMPTGTWQPGNLIRDNYGFILPADLPPGAYQLQVVVYEWPSLDRLPVSGPGGEDLGDHLVLESLEVPGAH